MRFDDEFQREIERLELNTPSDISTPAIWGIVALVIGFAAMFWAASV